MEKETSQLNLPGASQVADLVREGMTVEGERGSPKDPRDGEASGLSVVRDMLESGCLHLVLPSEIFVHFYPASPEQVINAVYAAGFGELFFELLGDELVAFEYLRIWRENTEKKTWIRSTSPLVVEYCRSRHPKLLPYLAPIVTPAVALARYLKMLNPERQLLYVGLESPELNGDTLFDAELSFAEFERLLVERGAEPAGQPLLLQAVPPERRRYLSTAGGLPLPMLDQERASSRTFRKLRGLYTLASVSRLLEENGSHLGFIDILPFDGALDHPALGTPGELYWRRSILELADPIRSDEPVITVPHDLDLSIAYEPKPSNLPEAELEEVERALERAGRADRSFWQRDPSGYASYLSLTESMMRSKPDLAAGLVQLSRDYSKAVRDATHDALTDLYSYRALVERVEEEMGQANRAGTGVTLLFIDLDTFKELNDRYGHPVGNEVLRRVADVLRRTIRSTDIAGRFGGDEFVTLLVNSDPQGAVRVAEQIRQRVAQIRVSVPDGEAGTTASIGLAFHSGAERSLLTSDDLFAEADASLYIAKAHGGNRIHPVVNEETPR
ncbi:MAG: diguanylate cyclase [Gemmatimonadota bacterium]